MWERFSTAKSNAAAESRFRKNIAIKAIGSAYHVDVLVFGQLSVSDPKPNIRLSSTWESMQAGADDFL